MAGGSSRSLEIDENARVLVVVRQLLAEHRGNQTALAPKLGIKQPTLSGMLSGRARTSYNVALKAAKLAGIKSIETLLHGDDDPYPQLTAALHPFRRLSSPIVKGVVASLDAAPEFDKGKKLDAEEWVRHILGEIDRARRLADTAEQVEARAAENLRRVDSHEVASQLVPMPAKRKKK